MTRHIYRRAILASPVFSIGIVFILLVLGRAGDSFEGYFGLDDCFMDPLFYLPSVLLNWLVIEVLLAAIIWAAFWVRTGDRTPFIK